MLTTMPRQQSGSGRAQLVGRRARSRKKEPLANFESAPADDLQVLERGEVQRSLRLVSFESGERSLGALSKLSRSSLTKLPPGKSANRLWSQRQSPILAQHCMSLRSSSSREEAGEPTSQRMQTITRSRFEWEAVLAGAADRAVEEAICGSPIAKLKIQTIERARKKKNTGL